MLIGGFGIGGTLPVGLVKGTAWYWLGGVCVAICFSVFSYTQI